MFINTEIPFVFIDIPKTGTRSITRVMRKQYGGERTVDHLVRVPHYASNFYTFCVLRNPYDRAVSMWWSLRKRENDSRGYIAEMDSMGLDHSLISFLIVAEKKLKTMKRQYIHEDRTCVHLAPQHWYTEGNKVDRTLRFEKLGHDVHTLPFVKTTLKLPKWNTTKKVTKGNPVRRLGSKHYMNKEVKERIAELYKEDFAIGSYRI